VHLFLGYSTLLSVLGVRCLPRHTFLQYVDHGLLQLTEPFVSRLMTGTNLTIRIYIMFLKAVYLYIVCTYTIGRLHPSPMNFFLQHIHGLY